MFKVKIYTKLYGLGGENGCLFFYHSVLRDFFSPLPFSGDIFWHHVCWHCGACVFLHLSRNRSEQLIFHCCSAGWLLRMALEWLVLPCEHMRSYSLGDVWGAGEDCIGLGSTGGVLKWRETHLGVFLWTESKSLEMLCSHQYIAVVERVLWLVSLRQVTHHWGCTFWDSFAPGQQEKMYWP